MKNPLEQKYEALISLLEEYLDFSKSLDKDCNILVLKSTNRSAQAQMFIEEVKAGKLFQQSENDEPPVKTLFGVPITAELIEANNANYPDEIDNTEISSRLRKCLKLANVKTWSELAGKYFIPAKHGMMDKSPVAGLCNINLLRNFGAQCLDQVHNCLQDRNIQYITDKEYNIHE